MSIQLNIDWQNQSLFLKESLIQDKPHLVFTVKLRGVTFTGKEIMFLLPDDRLATVQVSAVDSKGFPADIEDLVFSSSDETIITVDASGVITPVGIGSATVNVTGDALIGEGVETLAGMLEVQVVAGKAVALNVTAALNE